MDKPIVPIANWRGVFLAGSRDKHGLRLSQEVCADLVASIEATPECPRCNDYGQIIAFGVIEPCPSCGE